MAVALLAWAVWPQPNLFISDTGLILARVEAGQWVVSDRRRSRFAVQVFLEARGVAHSRPPVWDADCDGLGCSARLGGLRVTRLVALDDWPTDCARSDLIVADMPVPPAILRQCRADIIDPRELARTGSQAFFLRFGEVRNVRYARSVAARRF